MLIAELTVLEVRVHLDLTPDLIPNDFVPIEINLTGLDLIAQVVHLIHQKRMLARAAHLRASKGQNKKIFSARTSTT